jgi:hypothetical protein
MSIKPQISPLRYPEEKQQVPPLRCAPVGMTPLFWIGMLVPKHVFGIGMLVPRQKCHPDRSAPGFPGTLHWTRPRVRLS